MSDDIKKVVKEKYGQAAPSRAFITQILEEQGVPMTYEEVRDGYARSEYLRDDLAGGIDNHARRRYRILADFD